MRLEYEIAGVGLNQLRTVLRGAEKEIAASSMRVDAAARRRGAGVTTTAARGRSPVDDMKRSADAAAKELERRKKEDIKIRNAINNLEVRDWQRKEREKTSIAHREATRRRRVVDQEARLIRRSRESMGKGVLRSAGGAARNIAGMGGTILAAAGGIGAAMAVDATMSNEAKAIDIVNASSVNKRGRTSGDVQSQAGELAVSNRVMSSDVLDAVSKFQAPTGNLDQAMEAMPQLIQLARGTGTALGDMAEAAGRVIAADQDMSLDNLMTTMRTIAGQGKKGAVEIRELASAMAKLTGAAGLIGGDKGKAIAELGALAQMAVAKGGAPTGEEAGTATARFISQAKDKAAKFKGNGVNIEDANGMVNSPRAIIEQMIDKSQGGRKFDITDFGLEGNKAIQGYISTYNETQGSHADKMKAVRGAFDNMLGPGAVMSKGQVDEAAAKRMAASDAKLAEVTEKFHQRVGQELLPVLTDMIPTFTKLIPVVGDVTKTFAGFLKFLLENPVTGIGLIIGGAIVKDIIVAKVGERVAAALSSVVGGKGGPVPVSGSPMGTKITAGLAAGGAGYAAGSAIAGGIVDPLLEGSGAGERSGALMSQNLEAVQNSLKAGRMSKQQAQAFLNQAKGEQKQAQLNSGAGAYVDALFGPTSLKSVAQNSALASDEGLKKSIAMLEEAIKGMSGGPNAQAQNDAATAAQKLAVALNAAAIAAQGAKPIDPNRTGAPILKRQ